jgi:hypothetical protein
MTAVLDIKESKASFVMELLDNFSFVKVQSFTDGETMTGLDTKGLFAETFGMWANRDIDIKEIRKKTYERRTKSYDNGTL